MKKNLYILTFLALASCTAPIDINTRNAEPKLAIYSAIDDSIRLQRVYVSVSSPYFSSDTAQAVLAADVSVERSDGTMYPFSFVDSLAAYVSQSEFGAEAGYQYTLSVNTDFDEDGIIEEYFATSNTLDARSLDSIRVLPTPIMGNILHYMIWLQLTDPPEPNFYLIYVSQNGKLRGGTLTRVQNYRDDYPIYFNGQTFDGVLLEVFESQQSIEAMFGNDPPPNSYYFSSGDTICVQMAHIEKGYLEFIEQCQQSTYGSNPMMGGQPSNITTNLSGGAIGYFATYCLRPKTAYVP